MNNYLQSFANLTEKKNQFAIAPIIIIYSGEKAENVCSIV